jgi:cytochrome P450
MTRTPLAPEIAGYRLQPGDPIFVPIYAIHRHSLLWTDLDRFLSECEAMLKRAPRTCLSAQVSGSAWARPSP